MATSRRDDTRDAAVRVLGALSLVYWCTYHITGLGEAQQRAASDACRALCDAREALERFVKLHEEV